MWESSLTLLGASLLRFFSVAGEDYLAVSQGVGPAPDRLQPQSAILQWDGQRFGPLLSAAPWSVRAGALYTHAFAMRVPAGSAEGWRFLELPGAGGQKRVLVALSASLGAVAFSFDFPAAEGMRGLSASAVGGANEDGARLIYTVSDADAALGVVSKKRVEDSMGNYVASLSAQVGDDMYILVYAWM